MSDSERELSGKDQEYGYAFGCEGLVGYRTAYELLGGISRGTVNKLADQGHIRKGRTPGGRNAKVVFCRRSIREYMGRD